MKKLIIAAIIVIFLAGIGWYIYKYKYSEPFGNTNIELRNQKTGKCLHASPYPYQGRRNESAESEVLVKPCDLSSQQKWNIDATNRLYSSSANRCLDLYDGHTEEGSEVGSYKCQNNSDNQTWKFRKDGLIESKKAPGMCLQAINSSTKGLQIGKCDVKNSTQLWS